MCNSKVGLLLIDCIMASTRPIVVSRLELSDRIYNDMERRAVPLRQLGQALVTTSAVFGPLDGV